MEITLKNVKINSRLSEETTCFSADVWIDGAKAGEARNSGIGGCNHYHPTSLWQTLEAEAKTRPAERVYGMDIQPDADWLISDAITRHETGRRLTRLLNKQVVYIRDRKVMYLACTSAAQRDARLASPKLADWTNGGKVLNGMPLAEAIDLVIAAETDPVRAR